jgi:hypothetical protein
MALPLEKAPLYWHHGFATLTAVDVDAVISNTVLITHECRICFPCHL